MTKSDGASIARKIYLTICDVYDGDQTVDLDNSDTWQWCDDAQTALVFMVASGTLKASDLLDLAYYMADGDAYMIADMLTDGGMHNYLGGRLFAMHHDENK